MTTPTPAAWIDGDPLMEAMAAAVYEQCDRHPEVAVTIDDPRTIAAVAATVARQVLGTPTTDPAPVLEPQDHPGADLFVALQAAGLDADEATRRMYAYAAMVLRQEKATASAPAAPADRATELRELANVAETLRQFEPAYGFRKDAQISENVGILRVADHFRRLADEAQPTETDPFSREERERTGRSGGLDQPATAATEEPQP